jgi:CrcB protein
VTNPYFLVFLGGGIGSALRLGIFRLSRLWLSPELPFGTLMVNVLGGIAAGALSAWLVSRSTGGADPTAVFFMTGVLGGFTTFSAFSLDAVLLCERGQAGLAIGYVLASVLLSVIGVIAGMSAARIFT